MFLKLCNNKWFFLHLVTHKREMVDKPKLAIIREKLQYYNKPYISYDLLFCILSTSAPTTPISELSRAGIVDIIKAKKRYRNKLSPQVPDRYTIGALYMWNKPYMFGGLNIYNRYHLTTQLADRYTIYNTELSGHKIIAWAKFIFVKQRASFFHGGMTVTRQWHKVVLMSPERALIQLFKDNPNPEFVQSLPNNIDKEKLVTLAQKYCSKALLAKLTHLANDKANYQD